MRAHSNRLRSVVTLIVYSLEDFFLAPCNMLESEADSINYRRQANLRSYFTKKFPQLFHDTSYITAKMLVLPYLNRTINIHRP